MPVMSSSYDDEEPGVYRVQALLVDASAIGALNVAISSPGRV